MTTTSTRQNATQAKAAPRKTIRCPAHNAAGILKWIQDRWAEKKAVRLDTPNGSATYTWTRGRAEAQAMVKNATPPFEADKAGVLWMNHRRTRLRITDRWRITASEQKPRHPHRHTAATRRRMKAAGGIADRRRTGNASGLPRAVKTPPRPKTPVTTAAAATKPKTGTGTATDTDSGRETRR